MDISPVPLTSLDPVVEKIVSHLKERHDAALIAAPGCGATTLVQRITKELSNLGIRAFNVDLRSTNAISDSIKQLNTIPPAAGDGEQRVLIIDHAASLLAEDFKAWLEIIRRTAPEIAATCLWVGPLDARGILNDFGMRIHTVPKSHVSFPVLPRDETLAVYRSIAEANDCRWGEAILFLLLDFCGNDLSLLRGATEYLYGDWSNKLYDASIWDRISDWLVNDAVVNAYRQRMNELPEPCRKYLALIRLGGKPPCPREELFEEVDSALRNLCLQGFLVQNLLPRFYQLRNLTIRFLVHEPFKPWDGYSPEILFRRMTNERVTQLLQDVESMLRYVLLSVFQVLEPTDVRACLERKQGDSEFIPGDLNKAILDWASERGGRELRESLNAVLVEHRKAFRASNSVWARVTLMMKKDDKAEGSKQAVPEHLRCIDYLTFSELSDVLIDLLDKVFPSADDIEKQRLKERWREGVAKIGRLRNRVAHLRNVAFQDMEDLVGTVESMRRDLIAYTGWR